MNRQRDAAEQPPLPDAEKGGTEERTWRALPVTALPQERVHALLNDKDAIPETPEEYIFQVRQEASRIPDVMRQDAPVLAETSAEREVELEAQPESAHAPAHPWTGSQEWQQDTVAAFRDLQRLFHELLALQERGRSRDHPLLTHPRRAHTHSGSHFDIHTWRSFAHGLPAAPQSRKRTRKGAGELPPADTDIAPAGGLLDATAAHTRTHEDAPMDAPADRHADNGTHSAPASATTLTSDPLPSDSPTDATATAATSAPTTTAVRTTACVPWVSTLLSMSYVYVCACIGRLVGYHEYQFRPPKAAASMTADHGPRVGAVLEHMMQLPGGLSSTIRNALLRSTFAAGDEAPHAETAAEGASEPQATHSNEAAVHDEVPAATGKRSAEQTAAAESSPSHACFVVVEGRRVFAPAESLWVYALLARVDLPLTPELACQVRQLYLLCCRQLDWLWQCDERGTRAPPGTVAGIRVLSLVTGHVFAQRESKDVW